MDDDFNTPQGLAAIFELVNITNKNLDNREFVSISRHILMELTKLFGLGLGVTVTPESLHLQAHLHEVMIVADDIDVLIKEREEARKAKDFKKSDSIRKALEEKGIILEDTKEGTTWRPKL